MKPGSKDKGLDKLVNPVLPALILVFMLVTGTVGYYLLWYDEGGTFLDAFFMTVTTITTIGYGEVRPLNDTGRIFTILVAIFGIGSLFYVLGVLMENLVIYQLQNIGGKRKKMNKLMKMEKHIILVGSGRVGRLASNELLKSNEAFVVIDMEAEKSNDELENMNYITVHGDATQDEVLLKSGITRARGMIVATANPATTVFVVLSARVLNPNLYIVARADDDNTVDKLMIAGANRVVNPYAIGGQRLAGFMINPHAMDLLDTGVNSENEHFTIESFDLPPSCPWFGKSLKDINIRHKTGASILAVIRDSKALPNPNGDFVVNTGDKLLAMGSRQQLEQFSKHIDSTNAQV